MRREGANMLGLEGYGSSDEEEEMVHVNTAGPVPVDAKATDRGTCATDLGARLGRVGYTSRYSLVTCLLYTSPSPRDKRQSRMPSSA